ncbi:hypothetical protein CPCC7001_267 [Cyanobium sp. PCC 7001]|nr:hypothetical protein CPCC7001_267 [Cyanobium sp. PCC 7001]
MVVEDDPILLDFLVDEVRRLPLAIEPRVEVAALSWAAPNASEVLG